MKYIEGKVVPGLKWIIEQLDADPEVIANSNREKTSLRKFLCDIDEQFSEYLEEPGSDDRDNQDDAELFGDDDIAVGPGRTTATDFMDPPGDEDLGSDDDEDDGPDLDTGSEGYDDGFPK